VAENSALAQKEFNQAFVLMQYFGYLRRNLKRRARLRLLRLQLLADEAEQFRLQLQRRDMVKAFIVSSEYRQ